MADSMCGPSNPLQNFQKHSAADRTLQQDRLLSRQSPSQGFRSSPSSNGLLQQDFESFQAGQLPVEHGFQSQGFTPTTSSFQQPAPSSWASDFQRLDISTPPHLQQQPFNPQSQLRQDIGGWHQEFAQQQQHQGGEISMAQAPIQAGSGYRYSSMQGLGMQSQYAGGFVSQQAPMQGQQQQAETFDEEAFARAFDEAAQSEMQVAQETIQQPASALQEVIDPLEQHSEEGIPNQERIGADTIHDPLSPKGVHDQEDPNALSRTAARLLDSVRHNQSPKFQNSQFLQLMRQFREKEATVEGDKIILSERAAAEREDLQVADA